MIAIDLRKYVKVGQVYYLRKELRKQLQNMPKGKIHIEHPKKDDLNLQRMKK